MTCKDGVAVTDHLGNIFWDSIINRWLVEAFSSSSYVNWIEWMDNYVCVVGLDRIGLDDEYYLLGLDWMLT